MGVVTGIRDGLRNLVANLGTARDKATGSHYVVPVLTDGDLLSAYRGAWLPRKIVEIPALDSCRNWRGWQTEGDEVSDIEREETRLGVQAKVLEAMIKARLWGGAAVYIGIGDNDPTKPLQPERIQKGGLKQLNVLTRRILTAGDMDNDPESAFYGKPRDYTITSQVGQTVNIHPSRLVIFHGAPNPDPEMVSGIERGWGDSVLTSILSQIKQADQTAANIASLVFEAKIDVIKIPKLMERLQNQVGGAYEQQVIERLTLAATAKGINGCLILDSEEEYEQKSAQFGELTNILMAFMQLVSGAADIPVTRLLGQSPAGFNSTGDNDVRNYYDRIRAMQELTMTPAMAILDDCLLYSALGKRDDDVFYNWRSLWQSTEKERADIGKITAESIKTISDTKLIPEDVLSTVAVNMLTEAGVAPGLESEMEAWTAANPEGEDTKEDDIASLTIDPQAAAAAEAARATAAARALVTVDAAPRTLYVRRDVQNAKEIIAWAESQGLTDVADDLHVTIIYSRQAFDWIKAGNAREWAEHGRDVLTITEGGPRAVEPLGEMSAVLLFASSQLSWRHEEIVHAGASHDFPDYTPHISLTKSPANLRDVEPYRGRIVLGPEIFEEVRED